MTRELALRGDHKSTTRSRWPDCARAIGLAFLMGWTSSTVAADTYPRVEGVDVHEYIFRLELVDSTDAIEGLTTIEVEFQRAGLLEFPLDLVGVRSGETSGMTVSGVWIADHAASARATSVAPATKDRGVEVKFEHTGDRLRVSLPTPTAAGQRSFVSVAYAGTAATGLEIGPTKYGDRSFFSENWPNRARHWMPTIDHPYDKARSQMIVTAPAHYRVVSNGLLLEESDVADGKRITHWKQSVPIATWLNVLGVARFAVQHLDDFEGKSIQTWVYPQDREKGFHDFAVPTHSVLAFFSQAIGPYGYEKLANIQCNSVGGGMESASAIFYDDDSVTGERSVTWRNVVIHEIAHHWFGNSVTESDWDDVWLSEGFATYFTLLYREHAYGWGDFQEGLREARERVLRFYAEKPDYRIIHDNLSDMSQVTTGMQYQKGAWVLHMLRGELGTETFWKGIRLYYSRYRDGIASTSQFREVMEEVSSRKLSWFFDQWLRQGGVPAIQGTWSSAANEVQLDLQQTQADHVFQLGM
ncbi:MAG: M1 family metallopeptidase, partial [Planctomycetota bacterium]|nr:M1 family metallopeptidase [Planctomycetota bacterium]